MEETNKGAMREVKITAALNGWVVQCGCQKLVYVNQESLLADLGAYMKNPAEKEKTMLAMSVNAGMTNLGPQVDGAERPLATVRENLPPYAQEERRR